MFLVLSNNPKRSSATLSQSKNSQNTLYFVLGSFFLTQRASSTSFTEIQDNTLTQDVCPFPSLYFSSMVSVQVNFRGTSGRKCEEIAAKPRHTVLHQST